MYILNLILHIFNYYTQTTHNHTIHTMTKCSFCGVSGHNLRGCGLAKAAAIMAPEHTPAPFQEGFCCATTHAGSQCTRAVKVDGMCNMHHGKVTTHTHLTRTSSEDSNSSFVSVNEFEEISLTDSWMTGLNGGWYENYFAPAEDSPIYSISGIRDASWTSVGVGVDIESFTKARLILGEIITNTQKGVMFHKHENIPEPLSPLVLP